MTTPRITTGIYHTPVAAADEAAYVERCRAFAAFNAAHFEYRNAVAAQRKARRAMKLADKRAKAAAAAFAATRSGQLEQAARACEAAVRAA